MSGVSPMCEISGLLFNSTLLSSLLFFCLFPLLLLSFHFFFFCLLAHSSDFFVKKLAFRHGSCVAARQLLDGGMYSMQLLPYNTGICSYAIIYYSVCSFFESF